MLGRRMAIGWRRTAPATASNASPNGTIRQPLGFRVGVLDERGQDGRGVLNRGSPGYAARLINKFMSGGRRGMPPVLP